mgnify:CR=1 FL=1
MHPLVDIDVKGALAIQDRYPDNSLSIFIEAPSIEVLRERLISRGTETAHTLEERISKAEYDLTFAPQFNKIVINDNLEHATEVLVRAVTEFLQA